MFRKRTRVILHLGAEKTGSSFLQQRIFGIRESLENEGRFYPQIDDTFNHSRFAMAFSHPDLRDGFVLDEADLHIGRERMLKKIRSIPSDSAALLSSEHFHSRCDFSCMAALVDFFDQSNCYVSDIIVYFRDQASLCRSSYSTAILSGYKGIFNIADVNVNNRYYNNLLVAREWRQSFPEANLKIRSYVAARRSGLFQDFLETLGMREELIDRFSPSGSGYEKIIHPKRSAVACEIIRRLDINNPYRRAIVLSTLDECGIGRDSEYLSNIDLSNIEKSFRNQNLMMCDEFNLDPHDFPVVDNDYFDLVYRSRSAEPTDRDYVEALSVLIAHLPMDG